MNTSTFIPGTKKFFLGCILLIICNVLYAQKTGEKNSVINNWSININGGSTQYWGYINSRNFGTTLKHEPTWGYGIVLTRQITPVIGIRGQFLMGKLKGRKDLFSDNNYANLSYSSDFIEGNITAKVSFTDLIKGYKPNRTFTLYGMAGLGLSNFQGKTINYLTDETINAFGYGYGKGINGYELDGMGTVGIGLTVKLNKALDFTFENSMKFIHENKLNERNGFFHFDLYGYSSIGLSYNFGLKKGTKNILVKNDNQAKSKPITSDKKSVEVKKDVIPAPIKPEVKKEPKVTPAETVKQPAKTVEKVVMFTGYKVQILATLSPASFDNIMLQYNLKEQIREDHTDKWYRYSVGEFKSYREAITYRRLLYTRNKIKDAFVVKFVDGRRIAQVWK